MKDMRRRTLVVNADDFGQSAGITRGIIEAHERGIVTSASLMVLWPASDRAAAYARARPALSVGLHLDLGEWTYRDGGWRMLYARVDLTDRGSVEHAVRVQLERCCDLLGRAPTHLDSHQHVHRKEPLRSILQRLAAELAIPLRHFSPAIRHHGGFYGQSATGEPLPDLIQASRLVAWFAQVPDGVTELACHPGYADDLNTMYGAERRTELRTLCAGEVRRALTDQRIQLASFAEVEAA
jgi:predicted glycoside hydrolase/deacetylase ChbG (UPF0249 family)